MRFRLTTQPWVVGLVALGCYTAEAASLRADTKSKAVQEAAEAVMARFGARAGRSLPELAQKIESLVARYGEEALVAVRRVGPTASAYQSRFRDRTSVRKAVLAIHETILPRRLSLAG